MTPSRAARAGGGGRRLALSGALALLATLPYLGSLSHPLLYDDRTLLENPWLGRASPIEIFRRDFWYGSRHAGSDLYRPLTVLTLSWNLRAAPTRVGFRAVNLLLHVGAVLAVFGMLERVASRLGAAREGAEGGDRIARPEALCGAALFAVHPLASQAVLTAVGRAEILAALLGVSAFLSALDAAAGRARARLRLAGSTVLLLGALFSKESALAWPGLLLLWWLVARARAGRARMLRATVAAWIGAVGLFLAARAGAVGWGLEEPPWVDNPLVRVGVATRVANAVLLQGLYLVKMALPATLTVEYGYAELPVIPAFPWGLAGALLLLGGWAVAAVLLARRSPAGLYLWVFVPAAFSVTSNIAFPIGSVFAERLAYLPLAGACGLAGVLIVRGRGAAGARIGLALGVVALLAARTAARTQDYRSLVAFDEATAAASPRSVKALANVGRTRLRTGRPREAVEALERAVRIWPDYPRALALLAEAYARLGRGEDAARYRELAEDAARRLRGAGEEEAERGALPDG